MSVRLIRDGDGDGDSKVTLGGAPADLAIAPGATAPVTLTLHATGLPDQTGVIGGWLASPSTAAPTCACRGRSRATTTSPSA